LIKRKFKRDDILEKSIYKEHHEYVNFTTSPVPDTFTEIAYPTPLSEPPLIVNYRVTDAGVATFIIERAVSATSVIIRGNLSGPVVRIVARC